MTTTSLPRYEAWPVDGSLPATVWFNEDGYHRLLVSCGHDEDSNEKAAICAIGFSICYGGIADTSRVETKKAANPSRAAQKRRLV